MWQSLSILFYKCNLEDQCVLRLMLLVRRAINCPDLLTFLPECVNCTIILNGFQSEYVSPKKLTVSVIF